MTQRMDTATKSPKFVVFAAVLAYAKAGLISAPAAYAAPTLTYGAAPALAYGPAAPTLGSTFHGNLASQAAYAAPTLAYGAPAVAYGAAPTITSQSSNILRSFGNLGQVSTYSKTIDTPFSSVRKADIRVSNPGLRIAAAAPALAYSAAPALSYSAAPALSYSAGPALSYGAAPALYKSAAIAHPAAIGVAYSAAPAVSHINYASGYATYAY